MSLTSTTRPTRTAFERKCTRLASLHERLAARRAVQLLKDEGPGILRWALEGLRMALGDDREHGDIVLTPDQENRIEGLLAESESLKVFVETEVKPAPGESATTESLVRAYFDFCDGRGWTPIPATQAERDLTELMMRIHGVAKAHNVKNSDGKAVRGFRGVTI